ncbi:Alpha/Beta hydrolase protein [Penicillium riverlandense]|uniref:Alpha/Beta hydrolase protein n=1 Tax=Penicillium riverlandense TaxID=1903569 RepID=UPI002547C1EC|nr:Alpha/Beta hydrolase protein [Penicillium riverlandense]KAJ5806698.1 Alpha/Beta hydrolase protein [Penicillium riverlandense]
MATTAETLWAECLGALAKETGIEVDDIDDRDEFTADLGINPIVAKSIRADWEAILKTTIPATIFDQYPTVGAFHRYLQSLPGRVPKAAPRQSRVPLSVVLQGNPSTCAKTIFLLPDGSGSGMAYASIPQISHSTCLVAMNSPYLDQASAYICSIEQIAGLWIDEIRQRQPKGPYIVGGWSAGGYYSYEVANALIRAGERVSAIVLLDSPCRPYFEALPMEVVEYLSTNGLMGSFGIRGPPAWVVEHFQSTIRGVRQYVPAPMDAEDMPDVYIIWAREGVLPSSELEETGLDLSVKVSRFLLEGKPNYGTHGWERLFPGARLHLATISGNHFTLIHKPYINEIGVLLRDIVAADSERRKDNWKIVFGPR